MTSSSADDRDTDWREQLESMTPVLLAWSHTRLRGRPQADAEDLTQEILVRAIERIDAFAGGDLSAWVFAIGKLVLLEHHRRSRRASRIKLPEGNTEAHGALDEVAAAMTTLTRKVAKREDVQNLLRLVDGLDEQDRTLALLCGMEGQTSGAAAVQIGISEEAARKRWQRLRGRLRETAAWIAG